MLGGNGWGQLGNGTTNQSLTPVDVSGLTGGVTAIASTNYHTCAAMGGGGMKCWGNNWYGQLGDDTASQRSTPVDVQELTDSVAAIAAGNYHTCAVTASGATRCWGENYYGELGDGSYTVHFKPTEVSGLSSGTMTGAGRLTAGFYHTCALVGSGRLKCWGNDNDGQLGTGAVLQRETPVDVLETAPPVLLINYGKGYPGSTFTFTGWNYPVGALTTLTVDSQPVTTNLEVNPSGSFVFFLNTAGSSPGSYDITVTVNPSASTSFVLTNSAPMRQQEGGGQVFYMPGWTPDLIYLPLLQR